MPPSKHTVYLEVNMPFIAGYGEFINTLLMKEDAAALGSLLVARGWTWAEFGRRIGATDQRLNNWKKRGIPAAQRPRVASVLQMSLDELHALLSGAQHFAVREAPPKYENAATDIPPDAEELPVVSWVSAGRKEAMVNPYPNGSSTSTVLVHKKFGPNAYALKVRGDSMFDPARPLETFPPGAIIIVNPDARAENGSFVIARFDDQEEATFKKLVLDAGKVYLHPLNPRYPVIEVNGGMSIGGVIQATVFYRPE